LFDGAIKVTASSPTPKKLKNNNNNNYEGRIATWDI
jgi:hypothetical protein